MFFLLYEKRRRFWWFSEDFRPLCEDFRRFSKIVPKARRTFPDIFQEFPKIPEDVRRLPKTIEEDPKMFRWYTNYFKYNLRDKLGISETIDILTCEDIVLFLWNCYHSVYHWLLYNKIMYAVHQLFHNLYNPYGSYCRGRRAVVLNMQSPLFHDLYNL